MHAPSPLTDSVLLTMFAMTDLQPGIGTGYGAIDRLVYRDPVTGEMGVRDTQQLGALRHDTMLQGCNGHADVFVDERARRRRPLTLFDAPVAFLHIASFVGQSALVTSPSVLGRIVRTLIAARETVPPALRHDWGTLLRSAGADVVLTCGREDTLAPVEYRAPDGTRRVRLGRREQPVWLRSAPSAELAALGEWLSGVVLGSLAETLPADAEMLRRHLVVVDNDTLVHDLRHPKVFARNKPDPDGEKDTKIWNEEVIPSASVIISVATTLEGAVVDGKDGSKVRATRWLRDSIGEHAIVALGARQSGSYGQLLLSAVPPKTTDATDAAEPSGSSVQTDRAARATADGTTPVTSAPTFKGGAHARLLNLFAMATAKEVAEMPTSQGVAFTEYQRVIDEALSLFSRCGVTQMLGEVSQRVWSPSGNVNNDGQAAHRVLYDAARWLAYLEGAPERRSDWRASALAAEEWLVSRLIGTEGCEGAFVLAPATDRRIAAEEVQHVLIALKGACDARSAATTRSAAA